jgi:hypothetical protein
MAHPLELAQIRVAHPLRFFLAKGWIPKLQRYSEIFSLFSGDAPVSRCLNCESTGHIKDVSLQLLAT